MSRISVLEEVLEEEYGKLVRLSRHMAEELASLPKGSMRAREIRGRNYCYLNFREEDKVRSQFISAVEMDEIRSKLARRKELFAAMKE